MVGTAVYDTFSSGSKKRLRKGDGRHQISPSGRLGCGGRFGFFLLASVPGVGGSICYALERTNDKIEDYLSMTPCITKTNSRSLARSLFVERVGK